MKIGTRKGTIEGNVMQRPKPTGATINLEEKIKSAKEVVTLKVQRFNEINHLFKRRAEFFRKFLGKSKITFNA